MSTSAWSAEEYPGDTSPWEFVLFDVHCHCGWFLSAAEPVMSDHGVESVKGVCKRHGPVVAETWNIIDRGDLE